MTVLEIKNYGKECLWTPATPVKDFSSVKTLIADMTETCAAAGGVGLAANQVGRPENVFVWDYNGQIGHAINAHLEIDSTSKEYTHIEGCLSCYSEPVSVMRNSAVHMYGYNLDGEHLHWYDNGFTAAIWQHEVDHLNGHLLFDRLPRRTRRKYLIG